MTECIPEQKAISVRVDEGEIVITQEIENTGSGISEVEIFVWPHNLPMLIAALQALVQEAAQ